MVTITVRYLSKEICISYIDRGQAGVHYVLLGHILHAVAITELQIMLVTILVNNTS